MTREHIHKIRVQPRVCHPWRGPDEAVAEAAGVVVRDLTKDGILTLEVEHGQRSQREVLNAIGRALWDAGWTFAEAEITEMVDEAMSQAMILMLTGGTPGAYAKNEAATLLGAAVGFGTGLWAGSKVRKIGTEYHARWTGEGWEITTLPKQAPAQPVVQPA